VKSHYVLAPRDDALAERAEKLVADHQPGHGVRAIATAHRDSDFDHVIALQAPDDEALQSLLSSLELPFQESDAVSPTSSAAPLSLSVCGDVPCEKINEMFHFLPSQLPLCDQIVFLLCEFERDIHELVDRLVIPPVKSHLAGVAIAEGNTLLLELGNDDPDQLETDLEELRRVADIRSIRMVHAAGRLLVRSPHR
jgi:hypothetical protein